MTTQKDGTSRASYRSFLGVAVLFLLALLTTAGLKSYRDLAVARSHAAHLRDEIDQTRRNIEFLEDRIERIETDPLTLEQLAREELGMVRPGDLVIVLPEEGSEPPAP